MSDQLNVVLNCRHIHVHMYDGNACTHFEHVLRKICMQSWTLKCDRVRKNRLYVRKNNF